MKELFKFDYKKNKDIANYGRLSYADIKSVTKGFKHDKNLGVYTRKNCHYGYYEFEKIKRSNFVI